MTASHDDHIDESAPTGLSQNKADSQSPGEILREGRLAHEYSIADLCAQTKLSHKTVAALEDNDCQALSQPVFARGYYRQCAKVLDIDLDRMSRAYSAWEGEPERLSSDAVSHVNVIPQDVTPGGNRLGRLLLLLIGAVIVVFALLYLFSGSGGQSGQTDITRDDGQTNQSVTPDDAAGTGSGNDSAAATDNAAAGDSDIANGGTPAVAGDQSNAARTGQTSGGRNVNQSLGITPPNQGNDSPASSRQAESEPSVPPNRLTWTFNERSWVRVTDANGNRLASGIIEGGQSKTFNGAAPYEVRLGYAPGVKATIGGQDVDVAAQTNGASVATLTVKAPDGSSAGADAAANNR